MNMCPRSVPSTPYRRPVSLIDPVPMSSATFAVADRATATPGVGAAAGVPGVGTTGPGAASAPVPIANATTVAKETTTMASDRRRVRPFGRV